MANAIKKKEETNVIQFDPSMFEADANEGLGQLGQDDLAIPFLRNNSIDFSISPFDSSIAFLQSLNPTPVTSLNCLTFSKTLSDDINYYLNFIFLMLDSLFYLI